MAIITKGKRKKTTAKTTNAKRAPRKKAARTRTKANARKKPATAEAKHHHHHYHACGCPVINRSDWEFKEHEWDGRAFYTKKLNLLLHIPLGIGKKIEKLMDEVGDKGYTLSEPVQILTKDGAFCGKVMVGLKKTYPADGNVVVFRKAKLFSKVHAGPYNRLYESVMDLQDHVKAKTGKKPREFYFWYASCPDCFETKDAQKTIVFARV